MIRKLRSSSLGAILSFVIVSNITIGQVAYVAVTITPVAVIPAMTYMACSKDDLVAAAEDVLDVVQSSSVKAALQQISPDLVAKLTSAIDPAKSLVTAIKNGDFSSATGYVNTIFPIIDEIANHLRANASVIAIVALANIALHFIIRRVSNNVPHPTSRSSAAAKAIEYGSQRVWGCDYRKDKRCTQ